MRRTLQRGRRRVIVLLLHPLAEMLLRFRLAATKSDISLSHASSAFIVSSLYYCRRLHMYMYHLNAN